MQNKVENLGRYLKEARKDKNLTITSVAKELSISTGYISRIENGTSKPSLPILNALCNKYQINVRDIVDMDFLNKQDEALLNLNIVDVIMSDDVRYYDEKIPYTAKINILKCIDFILKCENDEIKEHIIGLMKCVNK